MGFLKAVQPNLNDLDPTAIIVSLNDKHKTMQSHQVKHVQPKYLDIVSRLGKWLSNYLSLSKNK